MTEETPMIAEIVTFRSVPDVADSTVVGAAAGLDTFLGNAPGFISRHLSRDDDGTWTDHVLWAGLDNALSAGRRIMADAAAAPFMAVIDPGSIRMTHAPVFVAQQSA